MTGDLSIDGDAPLVVSTLETQKQRLIEGEGPDLFVVDGYQILGDPVRGINYELTIAMTPPQMGLRLLSGSVFNPEAVVDWLKRMGRDPVSFFNGGEGLAIAAALEESSYSVDAIAIDIANLRAGFRFDDHSQFSHQHRLQFPRM